MTKYCRYLLTSLLFSFFTLTAGSAPVDFPRKVALLPLIWADEVKAELRQRFSDVSQLSRETVFESFAPLGFEDISLEKVDYWIETNHIGPDRWDSLKEFGVDGVLLGEITQVSISRGGLVGRTATGLRLQMRNLHTGETVWKNEGKESRLGGFILNSGQLVRALRTMNVTKDQGTLEYEYVVRDLCTQLFATLPEIHALTTPPEISQTNFEVHSASESDSINGLTVTIKGTPGEKGFFDIMDGPQHIPTVEVDPGVYYGFVILHPKQNAPSRIRCRIVNHYGAQAVQEIQR